jgi:nuclear transport factor 2 (NTF2) superfamily protein
LGRTVTCWTSSRTWDPRTISDGSGRILVLEKSKNAGNVWLANRVEAAQGEEIMTTATTATRPPLPPFTRETAIQKVRLAEDSWNTRDPEKVVLAYASDSRWRNRSEFINGRNEIIAFLSRKWSKELDYRLIKELWAFTGNRIAVRFAYEWHDDSGHWYRSYGNENWEFNDDGLMASRFACINDLAISESDRKYHWPLGRRPEDHPGLSELGL